MSRDGVSLIPGRSIEAVDVVVGRSREVGKRSKPTPDLERGSQN